MADVSFLDEVRALRSVTARCSMGKALAEMPDDLRTQVEAALDDPTLEGTAISKALAARGVKIGSGALQRHRRKVCSCE